MQNSELYNVINDHLGKRLQKNELTNDDIVGLIDLLGGYLNLKPITTYAKSEGISYNGALARIKSGKIKQYELFGCIFVIDNI